MAQNPSKSSTCLSISQNLLIYGVFLSTMIRVLIMYASNNAKIG